MRILLVEDDQVLNRSLSAQLERAGYTIDRAEDGREGLYFATEYPLDLAIIDLGLPTLSGVEIIKGLRAAGKVYPVLVLTARDRWQDKVEALKFGADDYVVKPFHVEELLARVDALLRRAGGWAQSELVCGPVTLDTRSQEVRVDDVVLDLTSFEYRLLEYLMLHAGEVLSKTQITEALYEQDFERDSNVIEVLIGRLRRKLDPLLCACSINSNGCFTPEKFDCAGKANKLLLSLSTEFRMSSNFSRSMCKFGFIKGTYFTYAPLAFANSRMPFTEL